MDMITYEMIRSMGESAVTEEQIKQGVEDYLEENPIETGATEEQVEAIKSNTKNIQNITKAIEKVTHPIQYKGDVSTYAELPTESMSEETIGYCYNVMEDGDNYVWAGAGKGEKSDGWDNLGPKEVIQENEIDRLF